MTLNEKQIEAINHTEGPCLVLAGAGSGKTKVLTTRIANLIQKIPVSESLKSPSTDFPLSSI